MEGGLTCARRHIHPRATGRRIRRIVALTQIHNMDRVELLDAQLLSQLVRHIIPDVADDRGRRALQRAHHSGGRGLEGAEHTEGVGQAQAAFAGGRGGCCGRCGGGGAGGAGAGDVGEEVVPEGGGVEGHDVVVLHEAFLVAGKEG